MHPDRLKVESVEEYLILWPQTTQDMLNQLRELIQDIAPEASEVISYAIPAYKLPGQGRAFAYISAYEKHIGLYPGPHGAPAELEEQLQPYAHGKGTFRFALDKPLPLDLIKQIVTQLYLENKK